MIALVNWLLCLSCSATFFLHVKVWAVSRPDRGDLWALYTMAQVLAMLARISCFPAERALAIYLCLLPARLMLVRRVKQMAAVEVADIPKDDVVNARQNSPQVTPLHLQANLGLGMLVKVMASRLMRTFYASHYQAFTPARVKLLARDPILSFFDCIDAVTAAYSRYRLPVGDQEVAGVGIDQGLTMAMPISSMALLLTRYSDWFAMGGGRHVGDLPFWLNLMTIVLVEWRDLAFAFAMARERCDRRPSNGPTSLSDFLAKSKIPDNLKCNPVLLAGN